MVTSKEEDPAEHIRTVRHDIRNQLSNINLLIEQLKHDMQNAPQDQREYLNMITGSIEKIDTILKSTE